MSKRIGLFGGTFDPVHNGHLRSAVELAERFDLTTLYLLPNHHPTHRGPTGASSAQRIAMLRIALDWQPCSLAIDSREATRGRPTFTYDTLMEIRAEDPQATVVFFLGMDAFAAFDTWHRWENVLELCNLVVINRPDAQHSTFSQQLLASQSQKRGTTIKNGANGVIECCDVTQLAISASDIRYRIAQHMSVRFLLPEPVSEYISEHSLYLKP